MRAGHKPRTAADPVRRPPEEQSGLGVFFVDLVRSHALLDAEEQRTPRLSNADRARAEAMAGDSDRCRLWRAARIATRIVLERSGGAELRNLDFEIEAGGRPGLRASGLHFSVSHSGDGALIAVSNEMPIGVDLEKKRTLAMTVERRRRLIAAAERLVDRRSLSASSDEDVLVAWVCLEAAAKTHGTGIGRLLTDEGVIGGQIGGRAHASAGAFQIRSLTVSDDYVAAIAAARLPEKIAVLPIPTENLREFLAGPPT